MCFDASLEETMRTIMSPSGGTLRASNSKMEKPRRPPNAYNLFFMEKQPQLKVANPNMSGNEISKELGKKWQSMDEAQRQPYKEKAKQIHTEFKAINPDYHYEKSKNKTLRKRQKQTYVDGYSNINPLFNAERIIITFVLQFCMQNKEVMDSIQQSIDPNLLPQLLTTLNNNNNIN